MEVLKLITDGSKILEKRNIASHKLDSEILLSKVLKKDRSRLLLNLNQLAQEKDIRNFNALIRRRSKREPIAYILREKEFWSKNFYVCKDALIPRPETELLVENIVKKFGNKNISILDVGTGSGCILLSILGELKNSRGIGIDISQKAIKVAKKNQIRQNLLNRSKFLLRSIDKIYGYKFDLIVSNPPYITQKDYNNLEDDIKKFEPKIALDGGNDGLDVIKKVIYKSKCILKINGMLALEIGYGQFKKVSKILKEENFKTKFLVRDYRENIRCILSTLQK